MNQEESDRMQQKYLDSALPEDVGDKLIEKYLRSKGKFKDSDMIDKFQQVLEIAGRVQFSHQVHLVKSFEMGWEIVTYLWGEKSWTLIYANLLPWEDDGVFYTNDFDHYLDRLRELVW